MIAPRMLLASLIPLGALVLATAGCGDDCAERPGCTVGGGPTPPAPDPACVDAEAPASSPAVIIGLGETPETFVPLTNGAVVERVNGSQGGQHIDIAARVYADRVVDARFGFEIGGNPTLVEAAPCANGWIQVVGRLFDPPAGSPTVQVEVLDNGTSLASESVTINVP